MHTSNSHLLNDLPAASPCARRWGGRLLPLVALAAILTAPARAQNFLVVVGDDLGVDRVGAYGEHPDPGSTPVIDALAQEGVLFRNAWADPVCSPSRACLLTGRHAFRTGVGAAVSYGLTVVPGLDADEVILPEMLRAGTGGLYSDALVGKWHLATFIEGLEHPLDAGFQRALTGKDKLPDYYDWTKSGHGKQKDVEVYATTDQVDDAIHLVRDRLPEPWLLVLSFHAPHGPYHAPPDGLHTVDLEGDPDASKVEHMKAMTQAMDREFGRLLRAVPDDVMDRTTILFLGDNGTAKGATSAPFDPDHAKGTVYEGGINVPLIIAGQAVPPRSRGREAAGLVALTDVFATLAELAGVDLADPAVVPAGTTLDSVSMVPYLTDPGRPSLRDHLFAETFSVGLERRAIRDDRFKLIRGPQGDELYDLTVDPFETKDLLDGTLSPLHQAAYDSLADELAALLAS